MAPQKGLAAANQIFTSKFPTFTSFLQSLADFFTKTYPVAPNQRKLVAARLECSSFCLQVINWASGKVKKSVEISPPCHIHLCGTQFETQRWSGEFITSGEASLMTRNTAASDGEDSRARVAQLGWFWNSSSSMLLLDIYANSSISLYCENQYYCKTLWFI